MQRETGEAILERVQSLHAEALLLLFSKPVNADLLEFSVRDLPIEFLYAAEDARKVYAVTAEQEAGRAYQIERVVSDGRVLAWSEPLRGSARRDTKPPEWIGLASTTLMENDPLQMRFSEPVRADFQRMLWVVDDSTRAPEEFGAGSRPCGPNLRQIARGK